MFIACGLSLPDGARKNSNKIGTFWTEKSSGKISVSGLNNKIFFDFQNTILSRTSNSYFYIFCPKWTKENIII